MASPLTEKILNRMQEADSETGCSNTLDKTAYELCRQNYFMKQQNQILQNQQISPKPDETTSQIQAEGVNNFPQKESDGISYTIPYLLVLVAVVVVTAIITKRLIRKGTK